MLSELAYAGVKVGEARQASRHEASPTWRLVVSRYLSSEDH
jgi:hypothetical protein